MEYKAGDTVCLKSDGPVMTVKSVKEGIAYCVFFHASDLIAMSLDTYLINKVKKEGVFEWVVDNE